MNRITLLALFVCAASFSSAHLKQDQQQTTPGANKAEVKRDEHSVDYEKFVKDLKRIDGNMTFYQKGKTIYLELPEDKLGEIFLLQGAFETGLDSGLAFAGMELGDTAVDAFKFERNDDNVWMVRPHLSHRWSSDNDFKVGAERAFPEAILGTYRIEQTDPEKKRLLVNITTLFNGDTFRLNEMVSQVLGGAYALDMGKSGPDSIKGFAENMVVQMKLHYFSPRGSTGPSVLSILLGLGENTLEDDRSAPVRVTYSMNWRKKSDFVARQYDPRIGYFNVAFWDLDKILKPNTETQYIIRWDLRKKDPKAKMSDPIKPIMWTIDTSIPEKYRPAIRKGVLAWNKAFEPLGLTNVMQVQDAPVNDSNYDHADHRYNVIRMISGPSAMFSAISLPKADPFTGEIQSCSVTLDSNTIQDLFQDYNRVESGVNPVAFDRATQVLLRDKSRTVSDDFFVFATPKERAAQQAFTNMKKFGWSNSSCQFMGELGAQASLAWVSSIAVGAKMSRDEYVNKYLTDCVMHEVGHGLGLRHNFAGSTSLSTAQLGDDRVTDASEVSASVMDYTPPNVAAILKGGKNVFQTSPGEYDKWAIRYGYEDFGAKTPVGEKFQLSQIAAQSGKSGHAFMTDADADSTNPYAVRFDFGSDPVTYAEAQLTSFKKARDYAISSLPKPGESYSTRTMVILSTITRSIREGRIAARFIGGVAASRSFKGDSGEKGTLVPVSPKVQRQALSLIVNHFLQSDSFALPKDVLETMSIDEDAGSNWTAPMRNLVSGFQQGLVSLTLSAKTTDQISENAYKTGEGAYSLPEHYGAIVGACFKEVGSNEAIAPLRRDLQRFVLNALITQAGAPAGGIGEDVRLIANDTLKRLDARFMSAKSSDDLTRLHLRDMHELVARFKARSVAVTR